MLQFPQFFGVFDLSGNLVIVFIRGIIKPGPGCQWSHGLAILQHVEMEMVPSFLTSAPGVFRWPPCIATGEISALRAPLDLLPALGWVDHCFQVLAPLISLLEETQWWPEMHVSVFYLPSTVWMNPTLPFQINAWLNQGQNFNVLLAIVLGRCGFLWLLLTGRQLGLGRAVQLSLT